MENLTKRKIGFYWVIFNREGNWQIAKWIGSHFLFIGTDTFYCDHQLYQIDEKQIVR
jgi:hypothetical protein